MSDDLLTASPSLQLLHRAIQAGESLLMEGLWNAPKALVAAIAQKASGKHLLILTGGSLEETRLYHDFAYFSDSPVVDFPAWETLPSENTPPSPDIVGERYNVLKDVAQSGRPHIVLSGLQACLQKILPPDIFAGLSLSLQVGQTFAFDLLIAKLQEMGYQRRSLAADKGEFAVRGGIIDLYPVASPDPFRIEFWGDEIESIRSYDPIGQKSVAQVTAVAITPAQELELLSKQHRLTTLLEYLGPKTIVIFDDLLALEDRYASLVSICGKETASFGSISMLLELAASMQKIFWSDRPIEDLGDVKLLKPSARSYYSAQAGFTSIGFELFGRSFTAERWTHDCATVGDFLLPDQPEASGQQLLEALSKLHSSPFKLLMLCGTPLEEETLQKRIADGHLQLPKATTFQIGYLSSGLVLPSAEVIILPYTEISGRYKMRRQKMRSTYHTPPSEVFDLSPGEVVVHFHHGIGKYLGVETRQGISGAPEEFLTIEYASNGKLYVPLSQAYLISRYIGAHEELPPLHTLGSGRWKATREKTAQAIMAYAKDLLELYAQREIAGGHACAPDSGDMQAFEQEFPYVETEDQLAAIEAFKGDMTSGKCMDRLVCGDVGYGKTEVAMRAAFKAVVDGGKQVAILVPTTVLAMQHYETFVDRFSGFPVNIGVLSRFGSGKQLKEAIAGIAAGTVDIAIGTHRLISKDVLFKNLGLVIIDEEQRFGVKAKEHLKKIKAGVDCLTMSATPIPRTLYMSLSGVRDLSVISTPPQDRLPITTIVADSSPQLLKSALQRELARDGQAYIIHNRVETIFDFANRIKELLPHARIAVCHGQMDADEIDAVFHAFKKGAADILVATTIVENGIDIPNANTILIDRADTFGLSALYQLRGRVGRWNRRAYAYFLVRDSRSLSEMSRKRLNALVEASGYGGGMKLAMRDLELRGAGNILGTEQSGQVAAIGFHLYCKMLKRTIQTLQKKLPAAATSDTKVEFACDARLTELYINSTSLRIEIYKRLGEAVTVEEVDAIWEEVCDRFGQPPLQAQWLYRLARIRAFAAIHGIISLKWEKLTLTVERLQGGRTATTSHLLQAAKTPQEMETKVLAILKKFNAAAFS
jgi:transcription-repair coupling factor (superfamily II helicase)